MLNIIFVFLIIHLHRVRNEKPEIYEEDADTLFKTILGDVYTIKHIFPMPNITTKEAAKANKTKILTKYEEEGDFKVSNMTKAHYEIRNLEELIQYNVSAIPDFEKDEIELVTRRFDIMRTRRQRHVSKDTQRSTTISILGNVNRTISLMEQFIYSTRNRLPYAQLLRKKYNTQLRYKVGYCLALVRNLKQHQMILYNSYVNLNRKLKDGDGNYETAYLLHLMVYEKVLRIDVDIKDVIKLIKKLEKQRREEEDPKDDVLNEDSIGNNSVSGLPFIGVPGIQNGSRPAGRTGLTDPKAFQLNGWRRMNPRAQTPVNLGYKNRIGVNPNIHSKRSHNKPQSRSQLWSPSNKIKRTVYGTLK